MFDLGHAVELRGESPDPSVPAGGKLLAVARPDGDRWVIYLRDALPTAAGGGGEAIALLRTLGVAPTEQGGVR